MASADEIDKLKERLKLLDIDVFIGKAERHAAEAYSHAKEAYSLRDEFFKLIEQHAYADLDSETKERLSLAAASLNAALGVADAAVATANIYATAAVSAQGNPCLDYNLLAAKASSEPIPSAYESSVLKDEKATNLDSGEIEALAPPTKDLISEDAPFIKAVEEECKNKKLEEEGKMKDNERNQKMDKNKKPKKKKPKKKKDSLLEEERRRLESEVSEVVAANKKPKNKKPKKKKDSLLEEERRRLESEVKAKNDAALELVVADAAVAAAEKRVTREAVREALAGDKKILLPEEEIRRVEEGCDIETTLERKARLVALREFARGCEEDSLEAVAASAAKPDQSKPANLDSGESSAQREAVIEGLTRVKKNFLREEEKRRLEEECKKKKLEEEGKMRDNERTQQMDENKKLKNKKDSLLEQEKRRLESEVEAKNDAAVAAAEKRVTREAVREALVRDKKILLPEEEIRRVEEGCDIETTLKRKARLLALRESFARVREEDSLE